MLPFPIKLYKCHSIKTTKSTGFEKTFTLWMDIRAELREIIYQGMKNFEWK